MNYSDEISKLAKLAALQRESGNVDPVTEELIEGLLTLVKSLSSDYADLDKRLKQAEEFSENLSMDLFDIQSLVLKNGNGGTPDDLSSLDLGQFFAQMNADSDEDEQPVKSAPSQSYVEDDYDDDDDGDSGSSFVRCPFCNTLIFGDTSAQKYQCPFCGGSFTRDDIV